MRRPDRLLLPLLLLLPALDAALAETCRSGGSFAWPAVDAGAWTGCSPSADDFFVVDSGHEVAITGAIRQSAASSGGVRVEAGGTLRAEVVGDALVIALGPAGLDCRPGSACILRGGYRPFGGANPRTLAAQSTAAHLRAGALVPCPGVDASGAIEPDCNGALAAPGDPTRIRFVYDAPSPALAGGLARLRADDGAGAGEDVLCFFDPEPDAAAPPADVNYCYRIAGVGAGSPAWLDFDVRQVGWTARESDYPIARRLPRQLAVAAPVAAGAREILVDGALLGPGEDGLYEGYWIHLQADDEPCGDGDAIPCRTATPGFRILDTRDGGAGQPDRLRIGDLRGVGRAVAAGETAWIAIGGWAEGDPISVWAPVVVRSASFAPDDSYVRLDGTTALRAVWFDDTGVVTLTGSSVAVTEARDLWIASASSSATRSGNVSVTGTRDLGLRIEHLTITGGNRSGAGADRLHGLMHPNGFGSRLELRDVALRYVGDDCIATSAYGVEVSAERVRCQLLSADAQTASAIDTSNVPNAVVTASDVECLRCSEPGADAVNVAPSAQVSVEGLLIWGGDTRVGASGAALRDVTVLGAELDASSPMLLGGAERFVLGEIVLRGVANLGGSAGIELRDGIVRDVALANAVALAFAGDAVLENLALVDVTTTAACTGACLLMRFSGEPAVAVRRVSAVWTPALALDLPGEAIPDRALHSNATSHAAFEIDGLLVEGHWPPPSAGAALSMPGTQAAETTWGAGPCFHDNRADATASVVPYLPPTTVQGAPLDLADLAAGRVDPLPGGVADLAGCGIARGVAAPGVRHRWAHALSRVAPERMADDADGDGVPEDAFAAPCEAGEMEGCADNCPALFNPGQDDADEDAIGDGCDVACANGVDDDGDGFTDGPEDPGCDDPSDPTETAALRACDDGLDDDGDGLVDRDDPGCPNSYLTLENPKCDNGLDDDGDGLVDFDDPHCNPAAPFSERPVAGCGLGAEGVALLAALGVARRRSASR